ncbi:hypothetical protein NDU88_000099 [Pleurodeles waltl]|uniref:Uncharacterized protein n=1 Tax=Pleurodeles waltl TaxID=8319 RepID=A0AAV7U2K3_PLEWA|nr:hypothetical protein NDU88_000099 [Pleurodeles waltl]
MYAQAQSSSKVLQAEGLGLEWLIYAHGQPWCVLSVRVLSYGVPQLCACPVSLLSVRMPSLVVLFARKLRRWCGPCMRMPSLPVVCGHAQLVVRPVYAHAQSHGSLSAHAQSCHVPVEEPALSPLHRAPWMREGAVCD